jgi:hypothetical protein
MNNKNCNYFLKFFGYSCIITLLIGLQIYVNFLIIQFFLKLFNLLLNYNIHIILSIYIIIFEGICLTGILYLNKKFQTNYKVIHYFFTFIGYFGFITMNHYYDSYYFLLIYIY